MPKIVVTDGYTLNPGDLSWEKFKALGALDYYDRTPPEQIVARCRHSEIIITNKTTFDANTLSQLPELKFIAVSATGVNIIDLEAANSRKIIVSNVPEYGTDSVAQHTIALMLELTNNVGKHNASVQKGDWSNNADWSYSLQPLIELSGKTLGIVGYGRIGQKVAEIARALGMKIQYHTPSRKPVPEKYVSIEDLFSTSDFISLHCPAKPGNTGFVNRELLETMKPTAYLINTSRGQLINEQDLADILRADRIAGAAIDVLSKEPPGRDNPLIGLSRCLLTPHNAWLSFEARQRLMQTVFQNVVAYLDGKPQNLVK